MTRSCTPRPLLLVDVDGVLSLFGFGEPPPSGVLPTAVDGIPHILSLHAGPLPARLPGLPGGRPHVRLGTTPGADGRHRKSAPTESLAGPERGEEHVTEPASRARSL